MRLALGLLTVTLVAGCPADDVGGPDAATSAGVELRWVTRPATVPGTVDSDLDLTSATLHLRNLRLVGDAGAGDPRTTLANVDLIWRAGAAPSPVAFPDAPPGLYARLLSDLDRGAAPFAFELTGTVATDDDEREPFAIRDTAPLAIDADFAIDAAPGVRTAIVVRVELDAVVEGLDFEAAPVVDGVRLIGPGDPQLTAVRDKLDDAIGVHGSDQ